MKKIIWILAIVVLILNVLIMLKKCKRTSKPQTKAPQSQVLPNTSANESALTIKKDISKLKQELKPYKISPEAFKTACSKKYSKKNAIKMCECEEKVLKQNGIELTNYWELLKKNDATAKDIKENLRPAEFRLLVHKCVRLSN